MDIQQHHQPPGNGKQSSGRRRHNRNPNRTSTRKTYASENDMPSDYQAPVDFSTVNPATDSMTDNSTPSLQPATAMSDKRHGKPRPNNVSISPGPPAPGRRTPPQTAGPRFASGPAFAGATFHASPAPSSLPIPSFLAKNFPDSPSNPTDLANIKSEPSPPASDSEAPTPSGQSSTHILPREESPLDLFFRADRAEKERARRASSANTLASAPGPFSPPTGGQSPQYSTTSPRGLADQSRRPGFERLPSSGGFSRSELNGRPGQPMGPAFSTPYQERIRAARSNDAQGQQPIQILRRQPQHVDRSDDLKRFLFAGKQPPPMIPATPVSPATTAGCISDRSGSPRTSVSEIQHAYAASSATSREQGNSVNLTAMEDSLRQILKLDLGGRAPSSQQS